MSGGYTELGGVQVGNAQPSPTWSDSRTHAAWPDDCIHHTSPRLTPQLPFRLHPAADRGRKKSIVWRADFRWKIKKQNLAESTWTMPDLGGLSIGGFGIRSRTLLLVDVFMRVTVAPVLHSANSPYDCTPSECLEIPFFTEWSQWSGLFPHRLEVGLE
jgi:hypothetical protein